MAYKWPVETTYLYDTNRNKSLQVVANASAVNWISVNNSAAGNRVYMQTEGSDSKIDFGLRCKGPLANITFLNGGDVLGAFTSVDSPVNYLQFLPSSAGSAVQIKALGTDTDRSVDVITGGAGTLRVNGTNVVMPSGTTKFAQSSVLELYNTSDQTTNYEKTAWEYLSNVSRLISRWGGSATGRALQIGTATSAGSSAVGRYLQIQPSANFFQFIAGLAGANTSLVSIGGSGSSSVFNSSNGQQTALTIEPGISQTGTASYTGLLVNPTESSTGSGTKKLIDAQVGGTSKWSVDNTGKVTLNAGPTISVGAGSPESAVTAPVGSVFLRTDGGAATSVYVKESGSGNTGWVAK